LQYRSCRGMSRAEMKIACSGSGHPSPNSPNTCAHGSNMVEAIQRALATKLKRSGSFVWKEHRADVLEFIDIPRAGWRTHAVRTRGVSLSRCDVVG
jgi:hypothetical protein